MTYIKFTRFSLQIFTLVSIIGLVFLSACQTQTSRYQSVYGAVTRVKSGDRLKIKGLAQDIKLFGITAPPTSTDRGKEAVALLHSLTRDGKLECLVMKGGGENTINGYCRFNGMWYLNHQMIQSGLVDINCDDFLQWVEKCDEDIVRAALWKQSKFDH